MVPVYQLPNKWQRFSVCITEKKCLKEGQYKKNSSSVQISQKDPGFQKRFSFIGVCQHVLCHQGCKILPANLKYMPQKGGKQALRKGFGDEKLYRKLSFQTEGFKAHPFKYSLLIKVSCVFCSEEINSNSESISSI